MYNINGVQLCVVNLKIIYSGSSCAMQRGDAVNFNVGVQFTRTFFHYSFDLYFSFWFFFFGVSHERQTENRV